MNKDQVFQGLQKMRWKIQDWAYTSGLKGIPTTSKGRRILAYHGVVPYARKDLNARFISVQDFEQQIRYFKAHFHCVSLEEYFQGASHPDKLTIALTFDDGYLNNLTEVLPVLEQHGVPATFYITTIRCKDEDLLWTDALDLYRLTGPNKFNFRGLWYTKGRHEYHHNGVSLKGLMKQTQWEVKKELVDQIKQDNQFMQDEALFPYFKLMEGRHIQKLSDSSLVRIGSHGVYHNGLDKTSLTQAAEELEESKVYLERTIQKKVTTVAFPDGAYTRQLIDVADKLGYSTQLALDYLFGEDVEDLRIESRFGINPFIGFNTQMKCIIDGKY